MSDRAHQHELRELLTGGFHQGTIVAHVVPGGGKSWLPGIVAEAFPDRKIGWFTPRISLQTQAAESLKTHFGIRVFEAGNIRDPSRGLRGFVSTHAALAIDPDLWKAEFRRYPYVLVMDELQHAKQNSRGEMRPLAHGLAQIMPLAPLRLLMLGTLDTNDGHFIHGLNYEQTPEGFEARPLADGMHRFIRYTRAQARREGALVPIEFHHHDGPVRWISGLGPRETILRDTPRPEEPAAIFTALTTGISGALFQNGFDHWKRYGRQLLIVTERQGTARAYYDRIRQQGISASLAIDEHEHSHEEIKSFRRRQTQALVTCQMCYEGLDAPDLTHAICLTHIRSTPWIEQMFGRIWRASPGKTRAWAFIPDDPAMNRVIAQIRRETPEIIGLPGIGPGGGGTGSLPLVIAESSELTSVLVSSLDGDGDGMDAQAVIEERTRAILIEEWGYSEDQARTMLGKIREGRLQSINPPGLSESEACLHYRKQIAEKCRQLDFNREVPFGTHQAKLFDHTKKSITDMTLVELRHAAQRVFTL